MDVISFRETCHNPICQVKSAFKTLVRGKLRLTTEVHPFRYAAQEATRKYPQHPEENQPTVVSLSAPSPQQKVANRKPTLIICGAGIAGVNAAAFLAQQWKGDIFLIDEQPPLSLTSDRSSECYRNGWSDPAMLNLMNRSIDLMESLARQTQNAFHLNRRGYLYVTRRPEQVAQMIQEAQWMAENGAGELRIHETQTQTYRPQTNTKLDGADLLLGNTTIRRYYPYLTDRAVAALHIRRAGWLSAQQLGMILLQRAQQHGVHFRRARLIGIDVTAERVSRVRLGNGESLPCDVFVNAAGPYLGEVGRLIGLEMPVENDLHLKMSLRDHLGVIDRQAPLLIYNDPQELEWTEEEKEVLSSDPKTQALLSTLPPGAHVRPEGGSDSQMVLMLWDYQKMPCSTVVLPPPMDELFPEVVLRGLISLLPGLKSYLEKMPRPQLDGGYYTHTVENRPLIGHLPLENAYVIGALSGFGIMAACAAAELLAAHILDNPLPSYAADFALERYQDPTYLSRIMSWQSFGQL